MKIEAREQRRGDQVLVRVQLRRSMSEICLGPMDADVFEREVASDLKGWAQQEVFEAIRRGDPAASPFLDRLLDHDRPAVVMRRRVASAVAVLVVIGLAVGGVVLGFAAHKNREAELTQRVEEAGRAAEAARDDVRIMQRNLDAASWSDEDRLQWFRSQRRASSALQAQFFAVAAERGLEDAVCKAAVVAADDLRSRRDNMRPDVAAARLLLRSFGAERVATLVKRDAGAHGRQASEVLDEIKGVFDR